MGRKKQLVTDLLLSGFHQALRRREGARQKTLQRPTVISGPCQDLDGLSIRIPLLVATEAGLQKASEPLAEMPSDRKIIPPGAENAAGSFPRTRMTRYPLKVTGRFEKPDRYRAKIVA
jgi:hypothetical protein